MFLSCINGSFEKALFPFLACSIFRAKRHWYKMSSSGFGFGRGAVGTFAVTLAAGNIGIVGGPYLLFCRCSIFGKSDEELDNVLSLK